MASNSPYMSVKDLPSILPVFPLDGFILLPRTRLPLNIFEPRYMAMVDDALKTHRLIGIVQPLADALQRVGGVGRITQIAETGDGRYLLTLSGISRFAIDEELSVVTPYRQCQVDYAAFSNDLATPPQSSPAHQPFLAVLQAYLKANDLAFDWAALQRAPFASLINSLAMIAPWGVKEKQALLEAATETERAELMTALAQKDMAGVQSATPLQ